MMMRRRHQLSNLLDVYESVVHGSMDSLSVYLNNGGNVNLTNDVGSSLLHQAVADNAADKVGLLIEKGCCINVENDSRATPLNIAIKKGSNSIVESLLRAGATVNVVSYKHTTPLMYAVKLNNHSAVKLILDIGHKCDVNMENYYGQTALIQAVMSDSAEMCEVLLRQGAAVKCIYNKNFTTNISRLICKNHEMMKVFLDLGSDINLYYHLMMACILKETEVAEMVLAKYDKPFQLKGLGFVTKQESDNMWERLTMCAVKPYRFATKCCKDNELLDMLLNFCDTEHHQEQRNNHQHRAKVLIRKLVQYGLVICPQTSFKSCDPSCDCRKCIFTALYGYDSVATLKGQCCSVIRQNLVGKGDKIHLAEVKHLNLPRTLQDYICMNDWN